jgi:hypothetical protein
LRMNIVYPNLLAALPQDVGREREQRRRPNEFASR